MEPQPDHGENSYRGSGRLDGKKAVITGADSGIGKAVAIAFAREGADVVIAYLDEHDDAEDTARWVKDAGRQAVLAPGDLSKPQACRELISRAVNELGGIDILVANAAFQMTHETLEVRMRAVRTLVSVGSGRGHRRSLVCVALFKNKEVFHASHAHERARPYQPSLRGAHPAAVSVRVRRHDAGSGVRSAL
jgi:NAD(P)-dependent dehydrogenase (short-subunit alcohol dehydrogenase family)